MKALRERDLHPLTDPFPPGDPTPDGADVTFNLSLSFDAEAFRFSINNNSFVPPTVPVLLQILSGAHNAHDLLPRGGVLTVERDKVIQVNLPSGVIGGPHPFHLHGVCTLQLLWYKDVILKYTCQHNFSVVKSADAQFNLLNPIQRDVVALGMNEGDFVAIRFRTDNPGPWILHW